MLDVNEPRVFVPGELELKTAEQHFFGKIVLEDTLLFGGTLGQMAGGVCAIAATANGKLIAQANSNGSILVYDTKDFKIIRLFEGNSQTKYNNLQFSSDNCS